MGSITPFSVVDVSRGDLCLNQPLRHVKNARAAATRAARLTPTAIPATAPLLSVDVDTRAGLGVGVPILDAMVAEVDAVDDGADEDLVVVIAGCLIVVRMEGVPGGS